MKRTEHNTGYVLIRAYTDSEWDNCDFAIIRLDEQWLKIMKQRQAALRAFNGDSSFSHLAYYDMPEGFYRGTEIAGANCILESGEDWAFVQAGQGELEDLPVPENQLDIFQITLTSSGTAQFTAVGKHTCEEFYTASFDIRDWMSK